MSTSPPHKTGKGLRRKRRPDDRPRRRVVGLDLTRRDIQAEAKKRGHAWELAKGFEQSCPISTLAPAANRIEITVNGKVQQTGDLNQTIWSVLEAIAYLSKYVELLPGDLLMTAPRG